MVTVIIKIPITIHYNEWKPFHVVRYFKLTMYQCNLKHVYAAIGVMMVSDDAGGSPREVVKQKTIFCKLPVTAQPAIESLLETIHKMTTPWHQPNGSSIPLPWAASLHQNNRLERPKKNPETQGQQVTFNGVDINNFEPDDDTPAEPAANATMALQDGHDLVARARSQNTAAADISQQPQLLPSNGHSRQGFIDACKDYCYDDDMEAMLDSEFGLQVANHVFQGTLRELKNVLTLFLSACCLQLAGLTIMIGSKTFPPTCFRKPPVTYAKVTQHHLYLVNEVACNASEQALNGVQKLSKMGNVSRTFWMVWGAIGIAACRRTLHWASKLFHKGGGDIFGAWIWASLPANACRLDSTSVTAKAFSDDSMASWFCWPSCACNSSNTCSSQCQPIQCQLIRCLCWTTPVAVTKCSSCRSIAHF